MELFGQGQTKDILERKEQDRGINNYNKKY